MARFLKRISILFLMTTLVACSDETDAPPLPPAIPAADLDVVDIYDETTDLSRKFREDNFYGTADNWYETLVSIYNAYESDYPYELAEELTIKAEAGDADAQFELEFIVGNTGRFSLSGEGTGSHTPDRCLSNYWGNKAAQQKHAPALTWRITAFLGGRELGHNRRLASFYFWTWSQLRGYGIKNYKGDIYPPLTEEEFQTWSKEFKTWDIANAVSTEPKSCPACTENCMTVIEK